ncbi:hypothetical protein V6N12_045163 [Hibiscus sabdariffa]|uniref:Uncharacterized protein n=1 Tax=Hibiscus sabdariffa TaxID=183260 RepID=A0ABR2G204_9ROSI
METAVKTTFGKGPKLELNVLTYQMCVLMFWNSVDRPSDIEIEQATGIFATYLKASDPWTPKQLFELEFLFFIRTSHVQPNIGEKIIQLSFVANSNQLEVADLVAVGKFRTQQCYSRDVDNDTKQASHVWILEGNELFFQLHEVGPTISDANKLRWQLVLEDLDGETMSKKKISCDAVLENHFADTILNAQ